MDWKHFSKVPIVPQWNIVNGSVCTPDGGILYVGSKSINYIGRVMGNAASSMKVFHTRQTIICVDIDPAWSEENCKQFAVLAQDGSVQVWDYNKGYAVCGHKAHFNSTHCIDGTGPLVQHADRLLLNYMSNRNVLSIDPHDIFIYCVASNTYCRIKNFAGRYQKHTILRCSPFKENIFALGTSRGLVLLCDIQQQSVIYTLRRHETSITALSWSMTNESKQCLIPSTVASNEYNAASPSHQSLETIPAVNTDLIQDGKEPEKSIKVLSNVSFDHICDADETCDGKPLFNTPAPKGTNISNEMTTPKHSKQMVGTLNSQETIDNIISEKSSCEEIKDKNHGKQPQRSYANNFVAQNETEIQKDVLLASASMDGNLCIWNADTGTTSDCVSGNGSQPKKNIHIDIAWLNSTTLVSNNNSGELIYWNLKSPDKCASDQLRRYKIEKKMTSSEPRGVVAMSICKDYNLLWCISSYREISSVDVTSNNIVAKYSCSSTNIAVLRECPDDMNKIALGFSDRRIGIIDTTKILSTRISIENFSSRVDSSVLSIVWSPDSKKLCFGTIEGRLGIISYETAKQNIFAFNSIFGKPVYSIDWQQNNIFAVCNEVLTVFDAKMEKKDGFIIPGIKGVTAVSVRNNTLFAGTHKGHLQIFKRDSTVEFTYSLLQEIQIAPRYVSEISWSPITPNLFAVVTNSNAIKVFDFNKEKNVAVLKHSVEVGNQKSGNTCLKWSNENKNEFLTCGLDGSIRVWDIASKLKEKFIKFFPCPMSCGLFLPGNEKIILCAGKSTSLEWFDMTIEKSENTCPNLSAHKMHINTLDSVQWAQKTQIRSVPHKEQREVNNILEECLNVDLTNRGEKNNTNCGQGSKLNKTTTVKLEGMGKKETELTNVLNRKPLPDFMKNQSTGLFLVTKELNKDALNKLYLSLDSAENDTLCLCSQLFGTKKQAEELLEKEISNQRQSEIRGISTLLMSQFNCSIREEILKCVQNKQLSEWHLAVAPTVSYGFWETCCVAFSEQLLEQGLVLQAATYKMAIHDQDGAINMLLDKKYFKEALLLARIYLQPEHPVINVIADEWIKYLESVGNLMGAALLCVLSNQRARAYEIISKTRNSTEHIERILQLLQNKHN